MIEQRDDKVKEVILVTGVKGMIGGYLAEGLSASGYRVVGVDKQRNGRDEKYQFFEIDLADKQKLQEVVKNTGVNRIVHLAALAHATGDKSMPYELYHHINVECAENVFQTAKECGIPVLFISTVDVYGFTKGVVTGTTKCEPVTFYGKTKRQAELKLMDSGVKYTIFRLSPVYTKEIKRDIQKRIYLKYPNLAYQIGKNTQYEVLNIDKAVECMVDWCGKVPDNRIHIIKDAEMLNTRQYIAEEKLAGNAKHVLRIPRWIMACGYAVLRLTGKNKYTFLINKAVNPLRSE